MVRYLLKELKCIIFLGSTTNLPGFSVLDSLIITFPIPDIYIYEKRRTVKSGIFDGFLEVFWIFLKNEHDKPLGTPNRAF